jgi:uncharacterized LabA/DUF88 family protein
MNANYFFIDGSALTAQIRQLQRADPIYRHRRLCPREFITYFMFHLIELHAGAFKRATFYFPKGDETAIADFIQIPDHKEPGTIRDLHFKFCGSKLKKSAEFLKFVEEKVPSHFQSHFSKSEKGIDTEMCCDALRLASRSSLDRLFLLSNDSDFIPLCRAVKEFGSNISVLHLSEKILPNDDLLREADSYDVVPQARLDGMFFPLKLREEYESGAADLFDATQAAQEEAPKPESEKPEAEPSDLKLLEQGGDDEEGDSGGDTA